MSEFTKYPLSEQIIPDTATTPDPSIDEIEFYVQRGKSLHSKAIREVLFAGFCSVGKAADRAVATVGQAFRKERHSPS
ncbi:hypothetical protein EOI86_14720 [Hwanghaeella grinnelliae]|uniref:Uncharacterized protein n=1 Tax=Hwanghaeella grinnelliae TaxID=2500179 RepID=A0A437QPL3_9PROT|nr:hypothetical protein [Hwanghaeella grinnelliae]RVU36452.1 hypothetical protein EOI86_14720 [Hwanghaeella grinnelliae]